MMSCTSHCSLPLIHPLQSHAISHLQSLPPIGRSPFQSISHHQLGGNSGGLFGCQFGLRRAAIGVRVFPQLGRMWMRRFPTLGPVCSSRNRGKPRGPLWRGRSLSNESLRAVQDLKMAKGDEERLGQIFRVKISRLLKADLLAVLGELQRQDECELAVRVFDLVRKEIWYKPDVILYADMIATLGRNHLIEEVETLFNASKEEGLQSHSRLYTEVVGAYFQSGMPLKAMEVYENLKMSGCSPIELTYTILIKGLERNGLFDLAAAIRKESMQALSAQEIPVSG
eukprot:c19501_g1_i1 orf=277-1125(+)